MPTHTEQNCPRCGSPVQAIAALGVCEKCLLEAGLLSTTGLEPPADVGAEPRQDTDAGLGRLGRYEMLEEIAHGGMGVVYRARDLSLNRVVALKLLLAGQFAGEREVRRFRAEAEAVARLDHPNVVPIYEVGEQDGRPFFSMKFMEGGTLTERMAANAAAFGHREAANMIAKIARAVHHAHQRAILHRDIKPGNILLDAHGEPHVSDFGLAKCLDSAEGGLTLSGAMLGSPSYMSPEQAAGQSERLTTATDTYSLGAVLYQLLVGRPPFEAATTLATVELVRHREPAPPRTIRPETDPDLETICLKCLEKEPSRRYGSAEALAEDLERWLRHEPIQARPIGTLGRLSKWTRRNPATATLVLLLGAVFIFGLSGIVAVSLRLASANRAKDQANIRLAKNVRDFEWQKIDELIASGKRPDALAYLASFLRQNPNDPVAATRLVSMMGACNFVMPAAPPLPHGTQVNRVALSRDRQRALTISDDGKIHVWNLSNGALLQTFAPPGKASECAFLPDERLAFSAGSDGPSRILEVETGKIVFEFPHGSVAAMILDPGRTALLESPTTIQVWDLAPPKRVGGLLQLPKGFLSATFDREGQELAVVGTDRKLAIWKVGASGPPHSIFKMPGGSWVVKFSPDRKLVATVYGDRIAFLDRQDGSLLKDFQAHDGEILDIAFTEDSQRLVSVAYDRPLKIWDVNSGEMVGRPIAAEGSWCYFYLSPDGKKIATRSQTGVGRLWDAFSGLPLSEPFEHQGPIHDLKFAADGQFIATASQDGTVQLWDARAGLPRLFTLATTDIYPSACFSQDGRQVYRTSQLQVEIFDSQTGQRIGQPMPHRDQIFRMQLSPDGTKLVTAGFDGVAGIWDARTGKPLTPPLKHKNRVNHVAFSPNGKWVATGSSDMTAQVWSVETGEPIGPPLVHREVLTHVEFRPDSGALLTASVDGTARLWSTGTGEPLWPEPLQHKGIVWTAEFSPDGWRIVTASADKSAVVWDTPSRRPLTRPMLHQRGIILAHFSPEGSLVLTCSEDGTARVWDSSSGEPVSLPMRHKERLKAGVFSPDGRLVLTGSRDGAVRLWDARTGYPVSEPLLHTSEVTGLQFSPNGQRCLSIANLDSLHVWDVLVAPTPVPAWFCDLVEAVAGKRLNVHGDAEHVRQQSMQSFRDRFQESGQSDFYSRWAHWFLHDRLKDPAPAFDPHVPGRSGGP